MTVLNLTPILDALGGPAATPATFKAEARRAGRRATRVDGATVAFATELTATWDGAAWDAIPRLYPLPVDCYWNVKLAAAGNRLERNVILPDGADPVAFGDLIAVTPDTAAPDSSTIAQYQATQQYVSNQVTHIDATAATIFNTIATIQAQIDAAAQQVQAAALALASVQVAQAAIDDDLNTVVTAATQTGLDRAAVAADRTAVETLAATLTTGTTIDGNA